MNRLVLCLGSLMAVQICSRVLVQPSCMVPPHIPWLSGVAVPQRKPSVGAGRDVSAASGEDARAGWAARRAAQGKRVRDDSHVVANAAQPGLP